MLSVDLEPSLPGIRRFKNATVGVPCFSQDLDSGEKFCGVCKKIWRESDERGFYKVDFDVMPQAAQFYAPAKTGVLCGSCHLWLAWKIFSQTRFVL